MTATRTTHQAEPAATTPSHAAAGNWRAVLWRVVAGLLVLGGASVGWAQDGVQEAAVAAAEALELAPATQNQQDAETHADDEGHDESRISDEYIPLFIEGFPKRPKPLIELGQPFLGTGNIGSGFTIPGGAVWTPSFVAFGTYRGGISTIDDGAIRTFQWANRLDFFGNLALTGSERFVFGFRPLDETIDGRRLFSGYSANTPGEGGFVDQLNFDWNTVSHLFFEGELGELFPGLDDDDRRGLDFGFSVGRQPISFQEGLLIHDSIDAIGITRNNFKPGNVVNLRFTGLYSWNEVNRNTPSSAGAVRNVEAQSAHLVAGFTEMDLESMTVAVDVIYVRGGEFAGATGPVLASDGLYAGFSVVGRPGAGFFNTALRVVTSVPLGEETPEGSVLGFTASGLPLEVTNPASRGTLVFAETSWTPHHTENYFYANGFYAIDDYRAAALDPTIPGPLARAGILFEAPGLGNVPEALSATAREVVGGAFGHQRFFGGLGIRQQLVFEGGGRFSTQECPVATSMCMPHQIAGGGRYQIAVGRRGVIRVDGFAGRESLRGMAVGTGGDDSVFTVGARAELVVQF